MNDRMEQSRTTDLVAVRPRCRCGVYMDCHHPGIPDLAHTPRLGGTVRLWLHDHLLSDHLLAPVWLRTPAKLRWKYVDWRNRSQRTCWSSLVDAALAEREDDACAVKLPTRCFAGACATTCDWSHPEHRGEHMCDCYCGKFRFTALEGALDRRERDWRDSPHVHAGADCGGGPDCPARNSRDDTTKGNDRD